MRKRFAFLLALLLVFLPILSLAEGEELLTNGDFSQGGDTVPDGWGQTRWTEDDLYSFFTQEWDEEYGPYVRITSPIANDARYEQKVKVKGNTCYHITALIRASGVEEGQGANLSIADTFTYSDCLTETGGEWVPVDFYIETYDGQKNLTLYLRLGGYGALSNGQADFARVSMVECEEPDDQLVYFLEDASADSEAGETGSGAFSRGMLLLIVLGVMVIAYLLRGGWVLENPREEKLPAYAIWVLLGAAFLLRALVAANTAGFGYDISCWKGWAQIVYQEGFAGFYTYGGFADYPPLYMMVLYPIGFLQSALNLAYDSKLFMLLVKLPSILADLGAAYLLFRLAGRKFREKEALGFALVYLLAPAVFVNASIWGQVDAILALAMVGVVYLLWNKKWIPASILMTAGILFKPQMIFIAPMFLPPLVRLIKEEKPVVWIRTLVISLAAAAVTALAIILPFSGGRPLSWIAELYTAAIGSYAYGSVNAANLPALLGGNWVSQSTKVLGLSYAVWGYLGIILSVAGTMVLCFKDKERDNGYFYAGLMITGIFTLAHSMHERYLFPALLLLAVGYALTGKKHQLLALAGLSLTAFLNQAVILLESYLPTEGIFTGLLCSLQVLIFAYMIVAAVFQARGQELPLPKLVFFRKSEEDQAKLPPAEIPAKPVAKWERWAVLGLTAVYAVVALVYLGHTKVPQTQWTVSEANQVVTLDLGDGHDPVYEIWQYRSLSSDGATLVIEESSDGESWENVATLVQDSGEAADVFKWYIDSCPATRRYLRLSFTHPLARMLEVAFKDEENNLLPVTIVDMQVSDPTGPEKLFDEQDAVPESPSQLDETYFDEIYHARTAWEFINGLYPYETTHPPLGKLIIALGIEIFGMTPFGWRFMGALFGILIIPLMYFAARELLKDGRFAFAATWMMTWDLMHFAHSRIATIDIFAVFWIVMMFFFMARYLALSHRAGERNRRLLWLALTGISFGLGCATKWICCYAGVGLAVIFFGDLIGFGRRDRKTWSEEHGGTGEILIRLGWCCIFFVGIPLLIYCLSYWPFMTDGVYRLSTVWNNQLYMYNYHSKLTATHFFMSPWYQWPFIVKPIWMYQNNHLASGMMGSIASFGNPAVWWPGALAIMALLIITIRQRGRDRVNLYICIGFLAQFLPWVFVTRCTFIYHYFASVPFIILALMRLWQMAAQRWPKVTKWIPLYLAVVLILFIFFYPAVSGLPVSSAYGKLMDWLPLWYFSY